MTRHIGITLLAIWLGITVSADVGLRPGRHPSDHIFRDDAILDASQIEDRRDQPPVLGPYLP